MMMSSQITSTNYDRSACDVGVVHLGFGAFHRAHQAVYFDDYMGATGDLRWGIAAVNLRPSESSQFKEAAEDIARNDGYYLKSFAPNGEVGLRRVRAHNKFLDWSADRKSAENLLALNTVHLVTITVTESGYYTDADGQLNLSDPLISNEISGGEPKSVYGYLRSALKSRHKYSAAPLVIACCDNIRQNGKLLGRNLLAYLNACSEYDLAQYLKEKVSFPCSMVDRITPRTPMELGPEITRVVGTKVTSPIMAEDFIQWVLQDGFAAPMPELSKAGVIITPDVDPYEETKIRVLNGGHTALAYLAALKNLKTFDEAMRDQELLEHFRSFEIGEVLPALTLELPFSKESYVQEIEARFSNKAIGDTVARICADGMAKFPIFIRPTLEGCLAQGILPKASVRSIASWHQFCLLSDAGKITFDYLEPSWRDLVSILGTDEFITSRQLWGDIPELYPAFAQELRAEIAEMELRWPV